VTRRDVVKAISPNRRGSDKSVWDPEELSRTQAEEVVDVVFDTIADALRERRSICRSAPSKCSIIQDLLCADGS
jgi:nucleoid DNA-binding protein